MSETVAEREQRGHEHAERMARLWQVADAARTLARTFSHAEEALDRLEETDPPPPAERTEVDEDDSMVAPPDPMPPLYEDTPAGEESGDGGSAGAHTLTWGAVARLVLAGVSALLAGWAGAQLLSAAPPADWGDGSGLALWLPGLSASLAASRAAVSLRRSPARPQATRRAEVRWSVFAVAVFTVATLTLAALLGAWTLWMTGGQWHLAAMVAVAWTAAAVAQVPVRPPEEVERPLSGALLTSVAARYRRARRQREDRATTRRWRQARGRARAAIRAHTEAWQEVHHRCHVENELGNPQAEQLAHALITLRGAMFGLELPGDSESAPDVPPLVGSLEATVHSLTVYHPDRLTRRLRSVSERAREEEA